MPLSKTTSKQSYPVDKWKNFLGKIFEDSKKKLYTSLMLTQQKVCNQSFNIWLVHKVSGSFTPKERGRENCNHRCDVKYAEVPIYSVG